MLDFGLVKSLDTGDVELTQAGMLAGTPTYIAPEVVLGGSADHRGDLYAVGGVAYFLLTGKTVFEARSAMALCAMHVSQPPTPPSERLGRALPEDIEGLTLACLAKEPQDRPQSALALRDALLGCADADGWRRRDANEWWNEYRDVAARIRLDKLQSQLGQENPCTARSNGA